MPMLFPLRTVYFSKMVIVDVRSLRIVESVTTNTDEIKQVYCNNDICILLCSKKSSNYVGYANTTRVYTKNRVG